MKLHKNAKIELIKRAPLFSQCSGKELEAIALCADELTLQAGEELTRQGVRGREFVVIAEGSADVHKDGRRVNRLGAGDFLGEIALISGAPRTATVTTTSQTRVLVLTGSAFERLTAEQPSVHLSVLAALSQRLHAEAL